ncbi:hypothetical protein KP014_14115 [Paenibacillus sophorae]|uniref:Uncharacterized protein n=1 Tax=Paenibacillus sophorae TaxID=1333845 RepID=A0ABX8HIV7_9BACL|nr:hypothetical protein KP014_14115 [Paenibacillus sophorae]
MLRPGEPEQYQFSCTNIRIALAGSDRRSGVTTTAFNLVCWLNNHGASACYVETNTSRHLAQIIHLFQPEQSGNAYVMEGCDFYFTRELNRDYNFIVMDCGVLGEKRLQADFVNADVRILCGSAMPYELPVFFRAMQRCSPLTVQALGMFVPEDMKPLLKKVSTENITFAESSHELFDTEVNSPFCKQLIANYL